MRQLFMLFNLIVGSHRKDNTDTNHSGFMLLVSYTYFKKTKNLLSYIKIKMFLLETIAIIHFT